MHAQQTKPTRLFQPVKTLFIFFIWKSMIHCSPISRIFISNDRFSRLPPNIKDSIRRILDLTRSQQKPLLYPNVKEYDLSDCSLPHDDLLIVSDILRNPLNGLLSLFMASVVAKKILPEPEYFLIGKPCSSSWCLHVFYQVLTSCKWFNRSSTTSQSILPVICQNKLTLRDRQLLNNMPGMCHKDRMRLGAMRSWRTWSIMSRSSWWTANILY